MTLEQLHRRLGQLLADANTHRDAEVYFGGLVKVDKDTISGQQIVEEERIFIVDKEGGPVHSSHDGLRVWIDIVETETCQHRTA